MGQGHSELAHLPAVNFNPNYELLQKLNEPHYGDVKYIRDTKTGQLMFLKELAFNNKSAFETEASYFSKQLTSKHPHIVSVLGYNFEDDHGLCSTHYKVSLFIEPVDKTLQKEIDSRKTAGKGFSEAEIVSLANEMISALVYFQSKGISHGDIRPATILSVNRVYKLSDPALRAQKGSNALTLAIVPGTPTLLAPELVPQIPKNRFDISTDAYKADVFSLGVTLLTLATLTEPEALYNYKKGTMNTALLQQRLEALKHLFSKPTYELINSMLNQDPNLRPDFLTLQATPFVAGPREQDKRSVLVSEYHAPLKNEAQHRVASPVQTSVRTEIPQTMLAEDDLDARIKAALERSQQTFRSYDTKDSYRVISYQPAVERTIQVSSPPHEAVKSTVHYENYYTAPVSTYTPVTTYHVPATTTYSPHTYEIKETTVPVRVHEVEPALKSYAHTNVETYSYQPAPVTTTYTPVTYTPATYTVTEQVVRASPTHHAPAPTHVEYKSQRSVFPEWQAVESFVVNPSPKYKPGQVTHLPNLAGLQGADEGAKSDRTAVSINFGDQTRAAAQFSPQRAGGFGDQVNRFT